LDCMPTRRASVDFVRRFLTVPASNLATIGV
jgi:hypothetical protein